MLSANLETKTKEMAGDVLGTVVIKQASPERHTAPNSNFTTECEHTTATSKPDDQDSSV